MKTNSLFLDGLNLIDGDYFCWVSNFTNADRDVITNDLYGDGLFYSRSRTKERKFLLNGFVKSKAGINALKQKLFSSGLKKLTVGSPDMPDVFIMCDLLNFAEDNKTPGQITCQLIATDPSLYDVDIASLTLGAISNTSLTFPITFPIVFGAVTGGSGVITNLGNEVAYPVITIVGICDTINITNVTTGKSMGCNQAISDGSTLIIDCRPQSRSITYNGNNRMDLKNINDSWLSCVPGDNVFVFTRNSLETKQHCSISLQSRWI